MTLGRKWTDSSACRNTNLEDYFDNYEQDEEPYELRRAVDAKCIGCPVIRQCFARAKFGKETGVWGGIYMVDGATDESFNNHKSQDDWVRVYMALTK